MTFSDESSKAVETTTNKPEESCEIKCSLHCEFCNQKMRDFLAKPQDGQASYLTSEAEIIQNLLEVTSKFTGKEVGHSKRFGRKNPFVTSDVKNGG